MYPREPEIYRNFKESNQGQRPDKENTTHNKTKTNNMP